MEGSVKHRQVGHTPPCHFPNFPNLLISPNPFWGALSAPLAHKGGSASLSEDLRAGTQALALNLTCTNCSCGQGLLQARPRTASLLPPDTAPPCHPHP